jgi:DNA-binding GntR family transcriptional regulator
LVTGSKVTSAARNGQHVATVYERLRKAILKGEIAPGATASPVALANQLGVSRTPLREALRLLEREGLVLSEPNRRARIAEFSISDVEELYLTRVSLEAVAARITVPTLTPDDFADIEGSMAQMDYFARLGDWQRAESPHLAFHTRLIAGAGVRVAAQLVQLAEHAARYRFHWCQVDPGNWETRRAEHRSIVEAAASGDAELTAARLVAHYARTALVVMAALDPEHEPRLLVTAMEAVTPASIDVIGEGLKGTLARRILQRIAHTEREV